MTLKAFRILGVAAIAVGIFAAPSAQAASPNSGKLSKAKRSLAWSGGPFTLSSPIPYDTGIDCLNGSSDQLCDHYALVVNLGDGAQVQVKIASSHPCSVSCLAAPVEGEDYDLHVYAPDGSEIATGSTPAGVEKVVFKHRARYNGRPYEVRIVPWAVQPGSTYKGTVKAMTTGR